MPRDLDALDGGQRPIEVCPILLPPLASAVNLPIALFRRSFHRYQGGHGKMWDYFQHLIISNLYDPRVYFTPDSILDESNPWTSVPNRIVAEWEPRRADLLFLGGLDWEHVPLDMPGDVPILNLIQHVHHAESRDPRYKYLSRKAIRICVSTPVSAAISATGKLNGPVFTIPCGIDLSELDGSSRAEPSGGKVLIAALKAPALGRRLATSLRSEGLEVELLVDHLPRFEFIRRLGDAGIVVLLPDPTEGFYLPGLEAMALGKPVIMPDCVGNSQYARHGENCLLADPDGIPTAIRLLRSGDIAGRIAAAGLATSKDYTLGRERQAFIEVLSSIKSLWPRQPP